MKFFEKIRRVLDGRPENAYGSWTELGLYSEGPISVPTGQRPLHWQHGWVPDSFNIDPDLVVLEDGTAHGQKADGFFVARSDQAKFLIDCGFESVRAIGLPFAYALKNAAGSAERGIGSLLIMPGGHATDEESERDWGDDLAYISYLEAAVEGFSERRVMLHGSDMRLGRDSNWIDAGFEVVIGGDFFDEKSLKRIALQLSAVEFVTTNQPGSHVVYAAAAGCRISISGPTPRASGASVWKRQTLYKNRPELVEIREDLENRLEADLRVRGIFSDVVSGKTHLDWGLSEIGADKCLEPGGVRTAIHDVASFPPTTIKNRIRRIPFVYAVSRKVKRYAQGANVKE